MPTLDYNDLFFFFVVSSELISFFLNSDAQMWVGAYICHTLEDIRSTVEGF